MFILLEKIKKNTLEERSKKMKILMLSWEYPPRIVGGISRVVYDLAQNLGEKGNG